MDRATIRFPLFECQGPLVENFAIWTRTVKTLGLFSTKGEHLLRSNDNALGVDSFTLGTKIINKS